MIARAAIVLAVLLLGSAAAVTLVPASHQQSDCGTWVAPEWTKSETEDLIDKAEAYRDEYGTLPEGAGGKLVQVADTYAACESALDTRRGWAIALGAAGVALPLALLFIAWGRKT